jgi:hypothetical protein
MRFPWMMSRVERTKIPPIEIYNGHWYIMNFNVEFKLHERHKDI